MNRPWLWCLCGCLTAAIAPLASADTLDEIRSRGTFVWGADAEGGGPYIFENPAHPAEMIGFEVDLADRLAKSLGVKAVFSQGPWDNLPAVLGTGQIDVVMNGYELTAARVGRMERTIPYYIYELALLTRDDNLALKDWEDLRRTIDGRRPKVGALVNSAAYNYLVEHWGSQIDVVPYDGNTIAMTEVTNGKLDAVLTDVPIAIFYRDRYPKLHQIGRSVGRGYYVIYMRRGDDKLRDALNKSLVNLLENGELQKIYERYGLWSKTQEELIELTATTDADLGITATSIRGWQAIRQSGPILAKSALMTIFLACASMPLAILIGLLVAIARLYGPAPIRWLTIAYVEILRGTPLMIQLFVIFFLLPEVGIRLPPIVAAIAGLAINYSAYEAEIYRAGLQAIPRGQMEAALALGMPQWLALRRVIIPQAVRIVVPPVTNDFIALFKDTSVCSVITVMELTSQYKMQSNNTGANLELALLTAILYLVMSLPLARLARLLEHRMAKKPPPQ